MTIIWANGFGPEESDPQDEFEQAQEMCSLLVDDNEIDDDMII